MRGWSLVLRRWFPASVVGGVDGTVE
jgi:hypothetical protein